MKLYSYWRSSASYRVRIALAYKNITYAYSAVHLVEGGGQQHRDEYKALNPMAQVPTLEVQDGGHTHLISQSLAILEYLEETHPNPPLLPKDPLQRARVRQLSEIVNAGIQPFQNLVVLAHVREALKSDDKAWIQKWLGQGMRALDMAATKTAGRFLVGDTPTFADLCLVPQMYAARRMGVPLDAMPTLVRVDASCNELPAFQAAHPDRQPDAVAP
jgi:maleylpyruvate isomerase